MAVIGTIRKYSWIAVALIGIAMLGFILQDAFSNGSAFGNKQPLLAEIDGENVKFEEFDILVNEYSARVKANQGITNLSNEDMHQIREMTWNSLVQEKLFAKLQSNLGIEVSEEEMNDMLYGTNINPYIRQIFTNPQTGEFDPMQVQQTLDNIESMSPEQQSYLKDVLKQIKQERIMTKYQSLVQASVFVPDFFAKYTAELNAKSTEANYAYLNYTLVSDTIPLTNADYQKYLDNNKAMFKKDKETRAVDFVVFNVLPTEEDLAEIEKRVNDLYSEFLTESNVADFVNSVSNEKSDTTFKKKNQFAAPWDSILFTAREGQFFAPQIRDDRYEMAKVLHIASRPDSLKASHILIASAESPIARQLNVVRTKSDSKKLADSLLNVARRNPAEFAALAQNFSDDGGTKAQGGELGWFLDGQMVPTFNDACLKGTVGEIVVVESVFGYHVIRIEGKTAPVKKISAAFIYVDIEPSAKTNKTIYTAANKFFSQAKNHEEFVKLAQESALYVRNDDHVDEMAQTISGLSGARNIVHWAYNKKTKVGDVAKEIYEYENQYVIASLKSIAKKGDVKLDDAIKPQIEYGARMEKKFEILAKQIADSKATNLEDLTAIGAEVQGPVVVVYNGFAFDDKPYEPDVVGFVSGLPEGDKISAAVQGRSGVFVFDNVSRTNAAVIGENDVTALKNNLMSRSASSIVNSVFNTFKNHLKIKDNRHLYY